MLAARQFLQDRFLGGDVGAHRGAQLQFVAFGELDDVLEDGLLVLARAFLLAARGDIERGEGRLAGARHGDGDFGGAARHFGAVDRNQHGEFAVQRMFEQLVAHIGDSDRAFEARGKAGDVVVEFVAARHGFFEPDDHQIVALLGFRRDRLGLGRVFHHGGHVELGIGLFLLGLRALDVAGEQLDGFGGGLGFFLFGVGRCLAGLLVGLDMHHGCRQRTGAGDQPGNARGKPSVGALVDREQ